VFQPKPRAMAQTIVLLPVPLGPIIILRFGPGLNSTESYDNVIDEIRRELSSVKKREQLSLKLRDLNDNLDNNSYKQDDLNREISPIQGHIRSLHNKLERINDLKLRRAERIRSDRATTEAIEWLKNNRSSFKKHVYFPICMEIDVKDTRYADAIENAIGYNLNNEDYRTMTNELCDKRGLRVNIVCFSHTNVNDFQSPLSGEE
ncbi:19047_t:CDS:2, partial [Entrophospora sp. SA101]